MDGSQIERVLANLLQNAIKYSPPGSAIGVFAQLTRNGELELSVDDHGPGIPAENRQRIFAPFFREQPAKHLDMPGHGLGLAICRSIILAHGGHIAVADRAGGGTRFSVLIPMSVEAKQVNPGDQEGNQDDDSGTYSRGGRRGSDAPVAFQQPEGQRLHGT